MDPDWDRSPGRLLLSPDGRTLYTTADDNGEHALFAIDIASGHVKRVAGGGNITDFSVAGPRLIFARDSLKSPTQLYALGGDGRALELTDFNDARLKNVVFSDFEPFEFKGWNGDTVHGYVVKPYGFEAGKKYPVAFLIHGGPQGSWINDFHYRWNPQTYAGAGFAVVVIDFHGSTGYGQAFTDAISRPLGRPAARGPAEGLGGGAGEISLPGRRSGLCAGRQLRRVHDQLDCRQLDGAGIRRVEMPGLA